MRLNIQHRKYLPALALIGLYMSSCVDEYRPELGDKYDRVMVVDGSISNLQGPYTVSLSLSTNVENPEFIPLIGYMVSLSDNLGNTETLIDNHNGNYYTQPNGIQGIPGRSYKIRITSPNGEVYESPFEKMEQAVEIDTIWAEYETEENLAFDHTLEGYRFFITTKASTRDSTYFLWKLDGTYKYNANHYVKYVFDGELRQFNKYDSLYTCWRTYKVPEIFTHHTLDVSEPYLAGYPLHYVNTEDKKLSIRYSLYAQQQVISKNAYEYWKNLREQSSNQGSFYSVQPFQVRGNINNIADPSELVLGYFTTASITDYRVFVNRPTYAKFHYLRKCYLNSRDFTHALWRMINDWPVYLAAEYGEYGQVPALPSSQECVNCTKSGGSLIQPDYWTENNK